MSRITWVSVSKIWCEHLHHKAELLEQRYYFDDPVPDGGGLPFKVWRANARTG